MLPIKTEKSNFTYKGPTPEIGDLACERIKPGHIRSIWTLSDEERDYIAAGGNIELDILTEPIPPVSLNCSDEGVEWRQSADAVAMRPVFYTLLDAQTELHLSRAWRITKRLLPARWFGRTKLGLANAIIAKALEATQPGFVPAVGPQKP